MKKMSLFLLFFFTFIHTAYLFFAPKCTPFSINAEENAPAVYACALSHDVYLYASENENGGLFKIPYTYYVKVIASGIEFSYVQYSTDTPPFQAIYGYCKTKELHFVDFVPTRPFLYYTLDVTYRLDDYADFFKQDDVFSSVTLTYAYYGDYTVGSSDYCYVCLDGKKGYLPKTTEIKYDLNTDYETPQPIDSDEQPTQPTDVPVGQIVLAAVVILLAVGIAYSLLRPQKLPAPPRQDEEFFDL